MFSFNTSTSALPYCFIVYKEMYRVYKCYYLLKFKASGYIAPQCREIFQTFV